MTFADSIRFLEQQAVKNGYRLILDETNETTAKISVTNQNSEVLGQITLLLDQSKKQILHSFSSEMSPLNTANLNEMLDFWKKRLSQVFHVYVDGSYINGLVGYGVAILNRNELVEELSGFVPEHVTEGTRQVAGELVAVGKVLNWCMENCVPRIELFYDYKGIECWAKGTWKAKMSLTQRYQQFVKASPVEIRFRKVDSHTGNFWNDRADELAKAGALSGKSAAPKPKPKQTNFEQTNEEAENPLAVALAEKAPLFAKMLKANLIQAKYDKVFNGQFARIQIMVELTVAGAVDIYNTRKKRWTPYFNYFSDPNLQAEIERLWQLFKAKELGK